MIQLQLLRFHYWVWRYYHQGCIHYYYSPHSDDYVHQDWRSLVLASSFWAFKRNLIRRRSTKLPAGCSVPRSRNNLAPRHRHKSDPTRQCLAKDRQLASSHSDSHHCDAHATFMLVTPDERKIFGPQFVTKNCYFAG